MSDGNDQHDQPAHGDLPLDAANGEQHNIPSTPLSDVEPAFDVAGAALGALSPRDEAELRSAAAADPQVDADLASMEVVVAELARLAPTQQMNRGRSAGIRSRLVARAAATATSTGRRAEIADSAPDHAQHGAGPSRPVRPVPPASRHQAPPATHGNAHGEGGAHVRRTPVHVVPFEPRSRLPIGRIFGGLALAAALVVAAFGVYSWRNRSQTADMRVAAAARDSSLEAQVAQLRISLAQKDSLISALTGMHTRVIDLMSYADASPMARMFWDQKKQMFILYASNVKPPARGKIYQVWLISRGTTTPVSAGTFMPDSTGSAVVETRHPMDPGTLRRVAVTEEPDGGMPTPTGPVVFAGVGR